MARYHLLILGAGLSGGLLARRCRELFPHRSILVLESDQKSGGNHTWSFHESDLTSEQMDWIRPLVSASWKQTEVHFPQYSRSLEGAYHSIHSSRFHEVLTSEMPGVVRFGVSVDSVSTASVRLSTGEILEADAIIDARGFHPNMHPSWRLGYQKFLGIRYRFERPHGVTDPILMDARVDQIDGYRFMYLLPFSETELLVEDTYYADSATMDTALVQQRIEDYGLQHLDAWIHGAEISREVGVLPIVLTGQVQEGLNQSALPMVGMRGGFFHPTTGYSLPVVMKWIQRLSKYQDWTTEGLKVVTDEWAKENWKKMGYFRVLNRMLFQAVEPHNRVQIFEKFYQHAADRIARFYASNLTPWDRTLILAKKPPVSIRKAVSCLLELR